MCLSGLGVEEVAVVVVVVEDSAEVAAVGVAAGMTAGIYPNMKSDTLIVKSL
jgi:hypothetical protein